jgi:Protein of unknown function (DUF2550)
LALGRLAAGTDWIAFLVTAGIVLAVAVICSAAVIAARRNLIERGGSVDCGLRRGGDRRWRPGLAEYRPRELRWHPVFGIRLRPSEVFPRRQLSIVTRRPADAVEATRLGLGPGAVVVECDTGAAGGRVELALSEDALTGFLAWLEAAPPGPGPEFG